MRRSASIARSIRQPSIPVARLAGLAAAMLLAACTPDEGEVPVDEPPIDPASAAPGGPVPAPIFATPNDVNPNMPSPAGTPAGTNLAVSTQAASEPYLIDGNGTTLYTLEGDRDGSACTDVCLQAWPPVLVTAAPVEVAPRLQLAKVGVVRRADGREQVSYYGHPLYRYATDLDSPTAGHGVHDRWGEWYLVGPQGHLLPEFAVESADTSGI